MRCLSIAAAGLAAMAIAWPAVAQPRPLCFEPGTAQLTPEAYAAIREAGFQMRPGQGRWPHAVLYGPVGDNGPALHGERVDQVLLELLREGVGVGRVKLEPAGQPAVDCLPLDVVREGPPYMALWHFWGPYFAQGSAELTPDWKRRMRFIVAGYEAGRTIYRVRGYADTAGSTAASLRTSRRRAENVAAELIRQGIRWDDIVVEAFGETQLARSTADGYAEPLNRRVMVDVRSRPAASLR